MKFRQFFCRPLMLWAERSFYATSQEVILSIIISKLDGILPVLTTFLQFWRLCLKKWFLSLIRLILNSFWGVYGIYTMFHYWLKHASNETVFFIPMGLCWILNKKKIWINRYFRYSSINSTYWWTRGIYALEWVVNIA